MAATATHPPAHNAIDVTVGRWSVLLGMLLARSFGWAGVALALILVAELLALR
jgi:hypothetical protein